MHRSIIALVGAAGIGVAALAAPAPANAGCYGCAVGAGILGGVAAGAIIGSAIANSPPPPPPPGYYPPPPPGAYGPPPPPAPACAGCRLLPALMVRLLPAPTRRHPLTLSWRPAVIGGIGKCGWKVMAISGGLFRSVLDPSAPTARLTVNSTGRLA